MSNKLHVAWGSRKFSHRDTEITEKIDGQTFLYVIDDVVDCVRQRFPTYHYFPIPGVIAKESYPKFTIDPQRHCEERMK